MVLKPWFQCQPWMEFDDELGASTKKLTSCSLIFVLQKSPESNANPNIMEQSYWRWLFVILQSTTDCSKTAFPKGLGRDQTDYWPHCSDILCGLGILSISLNNKFVRGKEVCIPEPPSCCILSMRRIPMNLIDCDDHTPVTRVGFKYG